LRVHVPGDVAVDKLGEVLLTLDREAGAAAAGNVVPLRAHIVAFHGLAVVVSGEGTLRVRAWQVALRELLTRVGSPAGGSNSERLHIARADRLVGGLQQRLRGGLRGVWLALLRDRRHDHRRRCEKQYSVLIVPPSWPKWHNNFPQAPPAFNR
jgi:hypothetical protein